jgi:hypothetical protein
VETFWFYVSGNEGSVWRSVSWSDSSGIEIFKSEESPSAKPGMAVPPKEDQHTEVSGGSAEEEEKSKPAPS